VLLAELFWQRQYTVFETGKAQGNFSQEVAPSKTTPDAAKVALLLVTDFPKNVTM
jgi:hypothetical protein